MKDVWKLWVPPGIEGGTLEFHDLGAAGPRMNCIEGRGLASGLNRSCHKLGGVLFWGPYIWDRIILGPD